MSLKTCLNLAGEGLIAVLEPGAGYVPTVGYEVAHDVGRWWDAILRLEAATGFAIPADAESAALENLKLLMDNPDHLLMNTERVPAPKNNIKRNPHNYREAFLALNALIRWRDDDWAREKALALVESMDRCLNEEGRLDFSRSKLWGQIPETPDISHLELGDSWFDSTPTSGRALEGLIPLYETTREPAVLALATRIAEFQYQSITRFDGQLRPEFLDAGHQGHNHSYHGTLKGLLRYGLLTGRSGYVAAVNSTYRNGIRTRIVHRSGWTPHDLGQYRFTNEAGDPVADPASAGDSAQIALWLATEAGQTDLLDDVYRLVGFRLLPAQMTREEWESQPEAERHPRDLGSWRIHPCPHANKGTTPDVHAAVLHSLIDIDQTLPDLSEQLENHQEEQEWEEPMPSGKVYSFLAVGYHITRCSPTEEPLPYYPG